MEDQSPPAKSDPLKLTPFLQVLSEMPKTSNILPVLVYPILENYSQWKNLLNNQYPVRSFIRGFLGTSAFVIGPIITTFGGFTWLKDRSMALYQTIPLFNLLPENIGIIICSAYIFSYFVLWTTIEITDLINNYKYKGTQHYLTKSKLKEIHQKMLTDRLNITEPEVAEIFTKINVQLIKDPKNQELNNMLKALRRGDLQTTLDQAKLLETKISIIDHKIYDLHSLTMLPIAPTDNIEHMVLSDPLNLPTPENLDEIEDRISLPLPERIDPIELQPDLFIANEARIGNRSRSSYSAPAIIRQYQHKISKNRTIKAPLKDLTITALKTEQENLISKRYIDPQKTFVMH